MARPKASLQIDAKKMKTIRLERGLKQEDMAERLCCSKTTYQKYENGTRSPDANRIKDIANILSVSFNDLCNIDEYIISEKISEYSNTMNKILYEECNLDATFLDYLKTCGYSMTCCFCDNKGKYIPIKAEDKDLYPDFPFTFSSKYSIELDLLRSKHKTLTELKWQLKILICDDKSSQFRCKIVNPIELSDIQRELMKFTIFNIENSIFLRKEGTNYGK